MTQSAKALKRWLEGLQPDEHGRGKKLAALTGLSESYVSRVLAERVRGDIRVEKLQAVADHMGRDFDDLHAEIYGEPAPGRAAGSSDVVLSMDAGFRRKWDKQFARNPRRAKQVLENLVQQEQLGYTDLISRIVRLVIELGPRDAAVPVATELHKWKPKSARPKSQKRRRTS